MNEATSYGQSTVTVLQFPITILMAIKVAWNLSYTMFANLGFSFLEYVEL